MVDVEGPLAGLIRRLDELRPDPNLTNLVGALEAAQLTAADVAAYVKATPRSYHRATVVRREHYELLVLTWLPGQGSVPHDHAGSVSAMLVVQGEAAEGCWRIAPDGYVDLDYETRVASGEMTAWQDAGIHTVHNPSTTGELLVTVNVYAPSLREFRRLVARPAAAASRRPLPDSQPPSVVVVGGGFSGSMTAAQILRGASARGTPLRVVLVERQGAVGEGLAYSTRDLVHLLNVPAGKMSAWPDRPHDFVEWVTARHGPVAAGDFLPRQWYGEYVRESLLAAAEQAASVPAKLLVLFDEVRRIVRRPGGGWMVNFGRGPSLPADAVVLAIGHRPPPDPIGRLWSGPRTRFIGDPWRAFATNNVGGGDPVAILGTGLTAIDAVLSLHQEPRQAPITLVSRRGLLPRAHATQPVTPADLASLVGELTALPAGVHLKTALRRLRRHVRELVVAGHDWRCVVDGLRPHTARLWDSAAVCERRRFLVHLRPLWEVHRHRLAPDIARKFDALVADGRVRVVAGRVAAAQADDRTVRLFVRERGDDRLVEIQADWVINASGPAASNSAESNPAVGSLLVQGWVSPDELALGLETAATGEALNAKGEPVPDLLVVGTLRKPALWESTAVPELRVQASAVAERVVAHLGH